MWVGVQPEQGLKNVFSFQPSSAPSGDRLVCCNDYEEFLLQLCGAGSDCDSPPGAILSPARIPPLSVTRGPAGAHTRLQQTRKSNAQLRTTLRRIAKLLMLKRLHRTIFTLHILASLAFKLFYLAYDGSYCHLAAENTFTQYT